MKGYSSPCWDLLLLEQKDQITKATVSTASEKLPKHKAKIIIFKNFNGSAKIRCRVDRACTVTGSESNRTPLKCDITQDSQQEKSAGSA